MSNQELELRGQLTKKEFVELNKFMHKKAKHDRDFKRFQILYYNDESLKKQVGYVNRDFRIRVENGKPTLTMKYGDWRKASVREEMHIPFLEEDLDEMIRMLSILGFSKGKIIIQHTSIFTLNDIEWAVVFIPGVGKNYYYFEAEISGDDFDSATAIKTLTANIEKLNLEIFTDDEFIKFCTKLDNIKGRQFDFETDDWKNYKEQFRDYI